jgi:hypothetical protein
MPHPPNTQLALKRWWHCRSHAILTNWHQFSKTYTCYDHTTQVFHQMETPCEHQQNRGHIIYKMSPRYPNPTSVSTYCHPLMTTYQVPRYCTLLKLLFAKHTPLYKRPPVLLSYSFPSLPATQHYPYPTNSLYTNY